MMPCKKFLPIAMGGTKLKWEMAQETPMPWTPCRQPSTPMCLTPWVSKKRALPEQVEGEEEKQQNGENTAKQALWVSSCDSRKGKRVWHRVTNAGWQIPMAKWNTACGWNFTKNPEKVRLSVALQFNQTRCRKCSEVMKIPRLGQGGQNFWQASSQVKLWPCLAHDMAELMDLTVSNC